MAELVFRIKADYEEAVRMRKEIDELEESMRKLDTTTAEGAKEEARLEAEYKKKRDRLNEIAASASKVGYYMGGEFKEKLAKAKAEVIALSEELYKAQKKLDEMRSNKSAYSPAQFIEAETRVDELSKALVEAQKNYNDLADGATEAGEATKKSSSFMGAYTTILRLLPAPIRSALGGFRSLNKAMLQFIKTPIGLAILGVSAALKGLSLWLKNTSSGQMVQREWTLKLSKATEEWSMKLFGTSKRLREIKEATASNATAQMTAYRSLQKQWDKANGSMEKQLEILKSDEWGKLGLSVESVNDAERILVSNSENVVKALIARAKAAALYKQIEDEVQKQISAETNADENKQKYENKKQANNEQIDELKARRRAFEQAQKDYVPALGYARANGQDYFLDANGNKVVRGEGESVEQFKQRQQLQFAKLSPKAGELLKVLPGEEIYSRMTDAIDKNVDDLEEKNKELDKKIKEQDKIVQDGEENLVGMWDKYLNQTDLEKSLLSSVGITTTTEQQDAEKKKLAEYNLNRLRKQNALNLARQTEDAGLLASQSRINNMADAPYKELSQMRLDMEKQKKQFKRQREDFVRKLNEEARNEWLAEDENRKPYDFADVYSLRGNEIVGASATGSKRQQAAFAWAENLKEQESEAWNSYNDALENFFAKYGTKAEQREALVKQQNEALQEQIEILEGLKQRASAGEGSQQEINLQERYIERQKKQNALTLAQYDYDSLGGNATKAQEISARQKVLMAEADLIEDSGQREIAIAKANLEITKMRYSEGIDIYDNYDDQVRVANELYEAEKAVLLLTGDEEKLRALELSHVKLLMQLAREEGDQLKYVFGNISKYTATQLKDAKKKIEEFKKSDEYKTLSPADRKAIDEQYAAISDAEFNKMFDMSHGGAEEIVQLEMRFTKLAQERKKAQEEGNKEEEERLTREMEQIQERLGKDYAWFGIDTFISGLQKAAKLMKEIGEMTEDEGLQQAGDVLGSVTQNLVAAEEGAKAWGGWWGAIIGGVTDLLAQGEEAWGEGKKSAIQYQKAVDEAKESIKNLRVEEQLRESGSGIFGQDSVKQIDSINSALDSLEKTAGRAAPQMRTYFNKGFLGFIGREEKYQSIESIARSLGADLYDKYGNYNADTLKAILNTYGDLTQAEKEWIEQSIKDSEHYAEGIEKLKSILADTFSDTSSMLADATIEGLSRGATIGTDRMKEIMSSTAQDMQKQLVQNIYAKYLETYSEEALEIMRGDSKTKQKDLVALYAKMFDNMETTIDAATQAAVDFRDYAEERGFQMRELANAETGAKAYSTLSETTGSAIEGRLTSLQISSQVKENLLNMMSANVGMIAQQMAIHVSIAQEVQSSLADTYIAVQGIKTNTDRNLVLLGQVNDRLENIDKKL